jgi:hypothetical protein
MMLAAGVVFLASALGHGQSCAWLNTATAGGLLGTDASVKVAPIAEHLTRNQESARLISGAKPDAVCTFLPEQAETGAQLEIAVHTMTDIAAEFAQFAAACGKDSISLRAVGNEAMECSTSDEKHNRVEKVIARTRDRAFLLSWTIPGGGPDAMNQDAIREKMRNLAEQVAGSLF